MSRTISLPAQIFFRRIQKVWLLHRRLLPEGKKAHTLEDNVFEGCIFYFSDKFKFRNGFNVSTKIYKVFFEQSK